MKDLIVGCKGGCVGVRRAVDDVRRGVGKS